MPEVITGTMQDDHFVFGGDTAETVTVTGGRGGDLFEVVDQLPAGSSVVIEDFDGLAGDILSLTSGLFGQSTVGFDTVMANASQDGSDTVITGNNGATIRLVGVNLSELDDRMVVTTIRQGADPLLPQFDGGPRVVTGTGDSEEFYRSGPGTAPVLYEGGAGDDVFFSSTFDGVAVTETGGDTILGGDGDDTIYAVPGDVVDGGAGVDTVIYVFDRDVAYIEVGGVIATTSGPSFVNGNSVFITVQDVLNNVSNVEGFSHSVGGDVISTSQGSDILIGDHGDNLFSGAGDDLFIVAAGQGGLFLNQINGFAGNDRIVFEPLGDDAINLDLATGEFNLADVVFDIRGIQSVDGTDFNDRIAGDLLSNELRGLGGRDTLVGGNGADTLLGGDGNDQLFAGMADIGNDLVAGGRGNDVGAGGAGSDTIVGDSVGRTDHEGRDTLFGGAGDDVLAVGGWRDEDGDGVLTIGELYTDGTFHETAYSGSGADRVYGADGNDTLGGGFGSDALWGFDGNDTIYGGLNSDEGSDDTIHGGAGDDQVFAAGGEDSITGGDGDDTLFAGGGDDVARGGAGNDEIYGGAGDDTLYGGDGADIFYFAAGHGTDEINDFTADDVLFLQNIADPFETVEELFASIAAGVNVVVDTGDGLIILNGVSIDDLSLDNVVI